MNKVLIEVAKLPPGAAIIADNKLLDEFDKRIRLK